MICMYTANTKRFSIRWLVEMNWFDNLTGTSFERAGGPGTQKILKRRYSQRTGHWKVGGILVLRDMAVLLLNGPNERERLFPSSVSKKDRERLNGFACWPAIWPGLWKTVTAVGRVTRWMEDGWNYTLATQSFSLFFWHGCVSWPSSRSMFWLHRGTNNSSVWPLECWLTFLH